MNIVRFMKVFKIFELTLFLIIQGNIIICYFLDIRVWDDERKIFMHYIPHEPFLKPRKKTKN